MIDELLTWGTRLFRALPAFMAIWDAVESKDEKKKLDAALGMLRNAEDQLAAEELGNAPTTPRFVGNPFGDP
jgi:hypothetical protein